MVARNASGGAHVSVTGDAKGAVSATQAASAALGKLARASANTGLRLGGMRKGAQQGANSLRSLGATAATTRGSLRGLGGSIAGLTAAYAALRAATSSFDLMRNASQFQDAKTVFEAAGHSLEDFRRSTKGLLSDQVLVQQFNFASQMGISAEAFKKFALVADAAAKKMGISQEFAFESLIKGTARASRLILDNVGIIVQQEQAQKSYAAQMKITGRSLTDTEKRQATLNAVMGQGTNMIEDVLGVGATASDIYDQFDAAVGNLKVTFGTWMADVQGGAPLIKNLVVGIRTLTELFDSGKSPIDSYANAWDSLAQILYRTSPLLRALGIEAPGGNITAAAKAQDDAVNASLKRLERVKQEVEDSRINLGKVESSEASFVAIGDDGAIAKVEEAKKRLLLAEKKLHEVAKQNLLITRKEAAAGLMAADAENKKAEAARRIREERQNARRDAELAALAQKRAAKDAERAAKRTAREQLRQAKALNKAKIEGIVAAMQAQTEAAILDIEIAKAREKAKKEAAEVDIEAFENMARLRLEAAQDAANSAAEAKARSKQDTLSVVGLARQAAGGDLLGAGLNSVATFGGFAGQVTAGVASAVLAGFETVVGVLTSIVKTLVIDSRLQGGAESFVGTSASAGAGGVIAGIAATGGLAAAAIVGPIGAMLATALLPFIALGAVVTALVVGLGLFLGAILGAPAIILGALSGGFALALQSERAQEFQNAISTMADGVLDVAGQFLNQFQFVLALFEVAANVVSTVLSSFTGTDLIGRVVFDTLKLLGQGLMGLALVVAHTGNAILSVGAFFARLALMDTLADRIERLAVSTVGLEGAQEALNNMTFDSAQARGESLLAIQNEKEARDSLRTGSLNIPSGYRVEGGQFASQTPASRPGSKTPNLFGTDDDKISRGTNVVINVQTNNGQTVLDKLTEYLKTTNVDITAPAPQRGRGLASGK